MQVFEDNFWGRVKMRMAMNGMTLRRLCSITGYNYNTAANQISINRTPKSSEAIAAFANALGCTPEFLITGKQTTEFRHTPEHENLISAYSRLSADKQEVVRILIDSLLDKQIQEDRGNADECTISEQ